MTTIRARELKPGTTILSRVFHWRPVKVRDVVTIADDCLLIRYDGGEYTVQPADTIHLPDPPADDQEALW